MATTPLNLMEWRTGWGFKPRLDDYRRLDVPTLIVWGTAGNWVSARMARALHSLLPASRYVELEGASHLMILTHATQVADLIAAQVTANVPSSQSALFGL